MSISAKDSGYKCLLACKCKCEGLHTKQQVQLFDERHIQTMCVFLYKREKSDA